MRFSELKLSFDKNIIGYVILYIYIYIYIYICIYIYIYVCAERERDINETDFVAYMYSFDKSAGYHCEKCFCLI